MGSSDLRRAARFACVAILLAVTTTARALLEPADLPYPVRWKVRVVGDFRGRRWIAYFGADGRRAVWRRETDVLSIDGPAAYHWETPLHDGSVLAGGWTVTRAGVLLLQPDLEPHPDLQRQRFPYNRRSGAVRAEARRVHPSADLSVVRGVTRRRVTHWDPTDPSTWFVGDLEVRVRGTRL